MTRSAPPDHDMECPTRTFSSVISAAHKPCPRVLRPSACSSTRRSSIHLLSRLSPAVRGETTILCATSPGPGPCRLPAILLRLRLNVEEVIARRRPCIGARPLSGVRQIARISLAFCGDQPGLWRSIFRKSVPTFGYQIRNSQIKHSARPQWPCAPEPLHSEDSAFLVAFRHGLIGEGQHS